MNPWQFSLRSYYILQSDLVRFCNSSSPTMLILLGKRNVFFLCYILSNISLSHSEIPEGGHFIGSWSLCLYFSFIVVTISWSNFLETIPTFKKEYKVSAVMKFNSLTAGNVFRFTLGNDWYQTGDLHPAVWITSSGVWKLSNWNCQAWVLSSKSMSIQSPKKYQILGPNKGTGTGNDTISNSTGFSSYPMIGKDLLWPSMTFFDFLYPFMTLNDCQAHECVMKVSWMCLKCLEALV